MNRCVKNVSVKKAMAMIIAAGTLFAMGTTLSASAISNNELSSEQTAVASEIPVQTVRTGNPEARTNNYNSLSLEIPEEDYDEIELQEDAEIEQFVLAL